MCVSLFVCICWGVLKWKYFSSSMEFKGKFNKLPSNHFLPVAFTQLNTREVCVESKECAQHAYQLNYSSFAYSIRWKSMLLESLLPIWQRICWSCLHWSMWYTQRLLRLSGRLLFELHQHRKLKTNLHSVKKISTFTSTDGGKGGDGGGSETASSQDSG